MKSFTMISSQEGTCGYKEDDWQIIERIETKEELFNALKDGYLEDARHRNDYPICSFPINIAYIIKELNPTYGLEYIDWEDEDQMDYRDEVSDIELEKEIKIEYQKTFEKFEKWKSKIKSLIPILRENKRKIDKEIAERKKLAELAEKYGYVLAKKVKKKEYLLASYFDEEYMIISEEEQRLLKNASEDVFITIENDSFYSCATPSSWKLTPESVDTRKISQSIKEFMLDEQLVENKGNIRNLIEKCKRCKI